MATVPAFADDTVAHQADLVFALQRPVCKVYQATSGQVIATATPTALTFNTDLLNNMPDNMHSTSVNTSRITIVTAGLWRFRASAGMNNNATGYRSLLIQKNGTTPIGYTQVGPSPTGQNTIIQVSGEDSASATDFYEIITTQTSGGNLTYGTGSAITNFFAEWLRT